MWFHFHGVKYSVRHYKSADVNGNFSGLGVASGDVELFHWLKAILFGARGG